MNRGKILDEAKRLTATDRNEIYGDPYTNHKRIADLWSVYLETEISPSQVALCLSLVKIARLIESPNHLDSYIDLAAYSAIAGEISDASE
jgi:Domain of unknown function (DUF6378)